MLGQADQLRSHIVKTEDGKQSRQFRIRKPQRKKSLVPITTKTIKTPTWKIDQKETI